MTSVESASPEPAPSAEPRGARISDRIALAAFVIVEVVALVVFTRAGRRGWFQWDDWDFLAGRTGGSLHDLLRPHGEHWSTVPILVYRALWSVFGLRYTPYVVVAVLLHLVIAALLRVIMRRARVGPWVATIAAALFALFGAGHQTSAKAFGTSFAGITVTLGLTYLLLVDHDGPIDRRDWVGVSCGLLALMSSGVAISLIVVVGIATRVRRGTRVALFHVAPLALVYVVWLATNGSGAYSATSSGSSVIRFLFDALAETFRSLGQSQVVGWALFALLAGGLVLAWRQLGTDAFRQRATVPLALLAGAPIFLAIVAVGRAQYQDNTGLGDLAAASHYIDVAAILVLPAIALAADAIVRRSRPLAPVALILLVVGIPGNLHVLNRDAVDSQAFLQAYQHMMLTLPRMGIASEVPRSVHPEPILAGPVTIGWLLDALQSGRLPAVGAPSPVTHLTYQLRLSLSQTDGAAPSTSCVRLDHTVSDTLDKGEQLELRGEGLVDIQMVSGRSRSLSVSFGPAFGPGGSRTGETLTATQGPLNLVFASAHYGQVPRLCH